MTLRNDDFIFIKNPLCNMIEKTEHFFLWKKIVELNDDAAETVF